MAELSVNTISTAINKSTIKIGANHHFRRMRKNCQNSLTIAILDKLNTPYLLNGCLELLFIVFETPWNALAIMPITLLLRITAQHQPTFAQSLR